MNLLLSSKLRLMDPRKFFNEREYQPCWYVSFQPGEKRRQCKWKVGVKFGQEVEEHLFGLASFDLEDEKVWSSVTSQEFALKLLDTFRTGGKNVVKEWLKDDKDN
jgi:hypothetical protein